ncbi:MAG: mercury(II) reductase [Sphingomonadales bacterium]
MNEIANPCCATSGKADNRDDFDLVVIGAGSAGFSASITAAGLGARVALIGYGAIGGTCVNFGCVPSKALIRAAEALHHSRSASRFAGIRGGAELVDWRALIAQKDELVSDLRQAKYHDLLPSYDNVTYIEGAARLTSEDVGVAVAVNGNMVTAGKIIIATGSRAAAPPISGIADIPCLTSRTALALEQLPASLLVIGAGYVGCELAQMFARAGVVVTLVCRSRVLPDAEPEISEALAGVFRDEGLTVITGAAYRAIHQEDNRVVLELDGGERLTAEKVLVSTGRRPNTDGLGLGDAGVALDERGGILVNDHLQTTNPKIHAAGDVTGRDQFVYMAAYGARLAAENALDGNRRVYDASAMPVVTFTDPQVASVGLTEQQARAEGMAVKTTVLPLDYLPRALAARDTRGLIKLVADKQTDRLLGAHVMAPEGADSIQTAALAVRHGLTTQDLADMIFPYLTTVEGLKLAAQSFDKDVTKLSCCAG